MIDKIVSLYFWHKNILGSPRLLSGATRLHPLAVLLAIAFGGMAGGVIGMMAALPLVVCVRGAVRGWRE